MVGARSAKRACLCFFLFCILAPNGAASHELAEGGEHEVGHQEHGQELGEHQEAEHGEHGGEHGETNEGGEGGHEEEPEEHEEEGEEKESLSAYSMGLTMLGMLVLLTFLYHLTHANRLETREISWKMLSGTISIFVGVVIYTAINSVFERLVMTNILGIDKDNPLFLWVNRLWVVFFYGLFILSTSAKARIGPFGGLQARLRLLGEEQARLVRQAVNTEMQASRARTSTTELKERPIGVLLKDLHVEGPLRSLVALFRKTSLLEQAEHEGEESKGSKAGFRAAVNYMKCSLFWAHAIGFAGIDGWNETQQESCKNAEKPWGCVWNSLWILGNATLRYYVIVRLLGIGWRFAMKKFIEPKCWVIVYHKDEQHDMVLKDQKGIFDKTEWPENEWIPFVQQSEEDEEEEEEEEGEEKPEKPQKQEFQLEWCDNGKYRFKYEGSGEENQPERYFTRKIGGKTIHEFDAPWNCLVYQYKVGEDEKDGKQGTYYAVPEHDELIEEWDDIRKDGENDFYALMLSFIVVQTMRLAVSGELPSKEEDENLFPSSKGGGHKPYEALILYGISAAFLAVAWKVYATLVRIRSNPFFCDQTKYEQAKDVREKIIAAPEFVAYKIIECIHRVELPIMRDELHGSLERILDVFVTVLCMSASWGMMYGTQWLLAMLTHITKEDENVLDVCLAISVTFSMFLLLQMADLWFACGCCKKAAYEQSQRALQEPLISDTPSAKWRRRSQQTKEFEEKQEKIAKSHKGAFAKINTSVGLLIGFSWEANFDKAIDNIAEALAYGSEEDGSKERSEIIIKVLCAAVFVSLLVPVWKIQIAPMTEEQGFKFGFIPRLLHARFAEIEKDMNALQSPMQGGDPERAERAQQTKKHIQEHGWHLHAIRNHLTKWDPKPEQPQLAHTQSQPVQHRIQSPIEDPKHSASAPERHVSNST